MRLDHLLSKEEAKSLKEEVGVALLFRCQELFWLEEVSKNRKGYLFQEEKREKFFSERPEGIEEDTEKESGGDALRGDTRSHSEHDG